MPNWTTNYLELRGAESNIRSFLQAIGVDEQADEPSLSFAHIIPEPDNIMDLPEVTETFGGWTLPMPGWYAWRRQHWGSKWDACDFQIDNENGPGQRFMSFLTAWDAPRAYCEKMVGMANDHNVQVWWDCVHEDGQQEETLVAVRRVAV